MNSPISEILCGALGAGVGGIVSFAALYAGGAVVGLSAAGIASWLSTAGALIGGGMVSGIFVLAASVAILGAGGLYCAKAVRDKKLKQETTTGEDRSIFSYWLRPGYNFYQELLRHREKVEVLEPAEVRNEVKRICGKNKKYVLYIIN